MKALYTLKYRGLFVITLIILLTAAFIYSVHERFYKQLPYDLILI